MSRNRYVMTTALTAILALGFFVIPSQAFAATAPVLTANAQSVTTQFNNSVGVQLSGTGPTGFAYEIDSLPQHGTLGGIYHNAGVTYRSALGNVTYTPTAGFSGADTFAFHTYKYVNSTQYSSADVTVTVTVTPQPQASNADYTTTFMNPVVVNLQTVQQGTSFVIVSGPTGGAISGFNSSTGVLTYTPSGSFVGTDHITFSATDGINNATATVSIKVQTQSHFAYSSAEVFADKHPEFNNVTAIPESHSGETKNSVQNDQYAMNLFDVLHFLDVKGWKTSDLTDGQFVYLMEHFWD